MSMFWMCVCIVAIAVAGEIILYEINSANELPYGRRAAKKLVSKIIRIEDANRVSNSYAIVSCNGVMFSVKVVNNEVAKGLAFETIPMYTSRSLLINDEEVVRVHKIKHQWKDKYFLEFSSKRKMSEVVEIVDAAYNWANAAYDEYISKTFKDEKSFYTEVK